MHSTLVQAVGLLALASKLVVAQTAGFDPVSIPSQDQKVAAGSNLTITWAPTPSGYDNDTISITLLSGADPAHLVLAPAPIASGIPNYLGTHVFLVPTDNLSATYGFKLTLDQQTSIFQYSNPFHITGGTYLTSSSAPATVTQTLAPNPTYTASANTTTASVVTVTNSSSIATTTASASVPMNSSNATMTLTSSVLVKTTTATSATGTGASASASKTTATASAATSSGAAVALRAMGGMTSGGVAVVGGLVLAFAL